MDGSAAASAGASGRSSLRTHGRTFHLAHLLLGGRAAADVHLLYGFCRFVDDECDERPMDEARVALARIRADLEAGASDEPSLAGYLQFCERHTVDPRVTEAFLRGVEQDLDLHAYSTEAELLRYCYRVAGTVGLLMCSLFDVEEPRARAFAVDLGIGMQLTNISRDVLEDACRGRVYVPHETSDGPLDAAALAAGDPESVARARRAVERLLSLATTYYRSADEGIAFLPRRAQLAVLTASRCYEAIGPRIVAHPGEGLPQRAHVGAAGKLFHLARAFAATARIEASRPFRAPAHHGAHLHLALAGLPGCDVPA
ncbi:MAG: phytoene/squalene synthase family protein [Planctomycetota bacterium]